MKKMFRELLTFKGSIAMIAITVLAGVLCTLGLPAYLSSIINLGIPNADFPFIVRTGGSMLILVLLGFAANAATGFFSARVSMGLGRTLRDRVFRQVQYFSRAEFDRFSTSSLITRTNNDITQVQNFMNMFLRVILMAPVMCVGGIVLAWLKSPSMSTVLLISMPVMLGAVLLIAWRALPLSTAMQAKIDRLNLVLREKLTGTRVIRAFGTADHESDRFAEVNLDYMKNSRKMQRVLGLLTPVLSLVLYGTTVALLALGGWQLTQSGSGLPVGDVIAVVQYVLQIMMSVMMLAMVFVMYPRASVSARRINEVLDTHPSVVETAETSGENSQKGRLTFRNVSFTYPGAAEPAVQNVSFEAGPGETTAIIGSTGSGKSSLLNLIPRFYDADSGEILVDGVSVRDYSLKNLREKLGYVPQKAFLFQGEIDSNIRFGDPAASDARVEEAAKIAQAYDFITAKEEGFDAPIAQGGSNVSGGQRQRLSIARAVVRRPEIYLFDDSFSALDFKTDAALRRALKDETREATVVLVAQRVSTIMGADRILVLEDGACVGMGTHGELLKTCPVYQEIVRSQMKEENT